MGRYEGKQDGRNGKGGKMIVRKDAKKEEGTRESDEKNYVSKVGRKR